MTERNTTKTQYYVAASIDGYIADRVGSLDWLMQFGMEEFQGDYEAFLADVGVVVMGSRTYEWLLADGIAEWPYAEQVSWVLTSRSLPQTDGADIRFVQGSVADLHPQWVEAAAGKNVWIVGGGDLAAQVADAGLLDEIILTTMPVALGAGTPLLPSAHASQLFGVESSRLLPSGAVTTVYRTIR
ncbi:MAG: dihydrofolate reductase [Herbiconiux sp.]|uniref:dihydrofolate reductase family protein n=1 Tax=Herbiconiux sp. TaxID=1871186 RepID=UPI001210C32E|nr:dihydrofolate reductase family protein [Herbiconiux sp.]TAJ46251.1 MAG: dihydrofolate reductase [Herbiconiux sp.]